MRFVENLCCLQIKLLQRIYKESSKHQVRQRAHYVDESGFCLIPYVPYAWQEKGGHS
jgi:hypothetical protein